MHVSGSHTRRSGVDSSFRNANKPTVVAWPISLCAPDIRQPPHTRARAQKKLRELRTTQFSRRFTEGEMTP